MEEVDKILIYTLKSIGCKFDESVSRINEVNQELFVECVSKILNIINPNENLPSQLPPNTGIKYRICTKFATLCQELGYKNEIGYQTFLYSNEPDMRRLLMFLIEKLPKDSSQQDDRSKSKSSKKSKEENLTSLISNKLNLMLSQCWTPSYCKQKSLRVIDQNSILIEGCKNVKKFNTISLDFPVNNLIGKSNYSKETQEYFEKHCPYVTNQVKNESLDLLSSLIQYNLVAKIDEQRVLNQDSITREKKKQQLYHEINKKLKDEMDKYNLLTSNQNCLTSAELFEIECEFENKNLKSGLSKGSRFTHIENLQYSKDDSESNVNLPSTETEEKFEEEIKQLKEKLENLSQTFQSLDETIRNCTQNIEDIERECEAQKELNKKLEENLNLKRKSYNLIEEAPKNLAKLKDEIENFDSKMKLLEQQWLGHKKPLEDEREKLNDLAIMKKKEIEEKLAEIKNLKEELKRLSDELSLKEDEVSDLNKSVEISLKESNKTIENRQFYTKRILEIVSNIEKQKSQIEKTLIETKSIQKDINQLTGKLERVFNETDEIVFKDAKKDDPSKKAYKLFISINENYEKLIKTVEETSVIMRELCDLEDQVNSEQQNNFVNNMDSIVNDYKQIKEENEQLMKKLKSNKK